MHAPADVECLATAIREHRPPDTDEAAYFRWHALVGAAGLALFGDDEDARNHFLTLCEATLN